MLKQIEQFSQLSTMDRVDAQKGIIFGVSVISIGEARGHNMFVDRTTLEQFLKVAKTHKDGIKTKFGDDHKAGAKNINGTLRNFRIDGDKVRADLCLLKSDAHFTKLIEMSQEMPDEFGLSASFSGNHELVGNEVMVRCSEIYSVDIVSDPAANKSLFSQPDKTKSMKDIALSLGLPETATEAEIKTKITNLCKYEAEAKQKMEAEAEAKKKLEAEEKKKKELEGKAEGEGEKFSALEARLVELSSKFEAAEKAAAAKVADAEKAVKLSEIKNLLADASRDGKVVPLSETELCALPIESVKTMLSKLPKGQIKLSTAPQPPTKDGKPVDKTSPEFVQFIKARREAGAIELNALFTKTN
jgi:Mu-like prophage I protein